MSEKIGVMLGDIVHALFSRPATTKFPAQRRATPARLRGRLQWDVDRCNGCGLCVKDCPASALKIITLNKAEQRFVLRFHLDRCTFCAQCVESCNRDALALSAGDWELATTDTESLVMLYGRDSDVESIVGGNPPASGIDTPGEV